MICFVCQGEIANGEAQVSAAKLPRRLRRYEGAQVHLRCHGQWEDARVEATVPAKKRAPRAGATEASVLFAEDIAARWNISRRQARRWLVRLEAQYGASTVGRADGRRGVRRYTTEAALECIGPRIRRVDGDAELREVVGDLLRRVLRLERLLPPREASM